jgi:hypothetical protein
VSVLLTILVSANADNLHLLLSTDETRFHFVAVRKLRH